LVLQGLTLPWLVRILGIADQGGRNLEEENARRQILETALSFLENERKNDDSEFTAIYDDLTGHYRHRLTDVLGADSAENDISPEHHERLARVYRELIQLERRCAVRLRNEGRINDETLRQLEHELDLRELGSTHME
jgi:monovalent cation/hydrogen antiporter